MTQSDTDNQDRASLLRHLAIVLLVCFVAFFLYLGAVGLHDFNEGLYVSVARAMYLDREWATPRENGAFFFDKPPLALWCSAVCFSVMGVSELAARFPVAVATTLLVLLTWWFGRRVFGPRAGLLAGVSLALCPLIVGTERQMTMDLHQSLWFAVAMVSFFLGWTGDAPRSKRWYYGFWAACGMGYMSKSVPGLFPLFLALAFAALETRLRPRIFWMRLRETRPVIGVLILLAITVPWHVFAYRAAGVAFFREYFIHHHVDLLTAKDFGHARPAWYYLPSLLWGMFPWSFLLPGALVGAWRTSRGDGQGACARRFTLVWMVGLVLMFSVMTSKLHSYLLPMYAAAALLAGDWVDQCARSRRLRGVAIATIIAGLVAVTLPIGAIAAVRSVAGTAKEADLYQNASVLALSRATWALGALGAGMLVAGCLALFRRAVAGVWAMAAAMLVFVGMGVAWVLPALDAKMNRPLHELARMAGERAAQGYPLAIHIANPIRPSVFFYFPASVVMRPPALPDGHTILVRGEPEPILAFLARRPAYVLTDERRAAQLKAIVPSLREESRRDRWVLLRADALPAPVPR